LEKSAITKKTARAWAWRGRLRPSGIGEINKKKASYPHQRRAIKLIYDLAFQALGKKRPLKNTGEKNTPAKKPASNGGALGAFGGEKKTRQIGTFLALLGTSDGRNVLWLS